MPHFTPPERILYACAATRHGPANLVPAYALGRSRIGHMVILRAVADPDHPDEAEQREAIGPAQRLADFAFAELGLPHDCIATIDGNPDSVLGWEHAARRIVEIAEAKALAPVVNLTGGPKQLALGLEHHLRTIGKPFIRLFYAKYPAAPLFIFPEGNALVEGALAAPAERAPLALLVEAARMEICPDSTETRAFRKLVEDGADAVRAIWPRLVTARGGRPGVWERATAIVRELNSAGSGHQAGALAVGRGETWQEVKALLDPEGRLGISQAGLAETPGAIRFCKGGWLEAVVFQALADALAGMKGAEVHLSVTLGTPWAAGPTNEVDVLVRLGDQLHLVEVKGLTTTMDSDETRFGDVVRKLAGLRNQLGGTACRAWLVAPFLGFRAGAQADWELRAADAGVTLLTGPLAVEALVDDVVALAR